jgi:hypothetical protein
MGNHYFFFLYQIHIYSLNNYLYDIFILKGEINMGKLFNKVKNQIVKSQFRREKIGLDEGFRRDIENELIFGNLFEALDVAVLLEKSYSEDDFSGDNLKVYNVRYIDNANIENNVGIKAQSEEDAKTRVMVNYTVPTGNILGVSEKLDPIKEEEEVQPMGNETPADVAADTAVNKASDAKVLATLQTKLNKEQEDSLKVQEKAKAELDKNQKDMLKIKDNMAKIKAS